MKKLFIVLAVASLGFVSCNNDSTSEADQKAKDSIEAKRVKDSTDAADASKMQPAGPTPAEIEAKRIADSTHMADSIKNAKKAPAKK
jgi:hypothetical protein